MPRLNLKHGRWSSEYDGVSVEEEPQPAMKNHQDETLVLEEIKILFF